MYLNIFIGKQLVSHCR